jgi:hypothetical protein
VIIMQRVHQDDLVGHVLGQESWNLLKLQGRAEHDEEFVIETVIGRRIFRCNAGDLLHPERESREVLDRTRGTLGEYNLCRPISAGTCSGRRRARQSGVVKNVHRRDSARIIRAETSELGHCEQAFGTRELLRLHDLGHLGRAVLSVQRIAAKGIAAQG